MATASQWWEGARPRTLPAALAPVAVGTGAAAACGQARADRAGLALVVALALQIGVNYANDYSDGVRGTDDQRVGPLRLTASGVARPRTVLAAALGSFAVAAAAGLGLVAVSGRWWLLLVGVLCLLGAWYYTGGRHPYGYAGLGEVAVFVFFGLVAVLGTTYTQALEVRSAAVGAAVAVGALACALLVTNNLRDLPTDAVAGKRTLAVRLGDAGTRRLYQALLGLAAAATLAVALTRPWALMALAAAVAALGPVRAVRSGATGRELLVVLRDTGRLELVHAFLLATGLALG
ncbi:MAG: 1,4-dihydroxy-2-naphthoate polyprenyltransferase [Actinomycetota bacterium]|nr:1,4-dihydroxy-2-naphthoate polyprenyltransferase [Actinomycetota bacterium]